jgi:hypothetical protein
MKRPQTQARAQRRLYERFLKKFNPTAYKEWKAGVQERGAKLHAQNEEAVRKAEEAKYEEIQTAMIQSMKAEGKSSEEIDAHIAEWVQTIKVWGSKERPARLREIRRENRLAENSVS